MKTVKRMIIGVGIAVLAAYQLRWLAQAVRDHAHGRAYDALDAYNLLAGIGMVLLLARFLRRDRRGDIAVWPYVGLVAMDLAIMAALAVMTLPLGD